MGSTRLPGKPMADINGLPMIVHVWKRAMEANIGTPLVCTDSQEVLEAIHAVGGEAVMTKSDHPSGSDRIWEAVSKFDPNAEADFIVNVQGDLPTIPANLIKASLKPLSNKDVDIATLATQIWDEDEKKDPNVVKVIGSPNGENSLRALYFTRATAPHGDGPLYHHIGLYTYRRAALEKFVSLKPSTLEKREKLEQLRALEAGMRIDVSLVDTAPLGVDTPADLETARTLLSK